MLSTFVFILVTWFAVGFVAAWVFGYPWREVITGGIAGILTGLLTLGTILTFNRDLARVFWEQDKASPKMEVWGWYFAVPVLLLVLLGVISLWLWLIGG